MSYYTFPLGTIGNLEAQETFILLESARNSRENRYSYLFTRPREIISCLRPDDLEKCFSRLESETKKGRWLAGFISYEAGEKLAGLKTSGQTRHDFPLLWMGIFSPPLIFDHHGNSFNRKSAARTSLPFSASAGYRLKGLKLNVSWPEYEKNIRRIHRLISRGDTYQVNYTLKYKFRFSGSKIKLYQNLRENQDAGYSAFLRSSGFSLLSFSPELFFRRDNDTISVRPMKGTFPRGYDQRQDSLQAYSLKKDPKNRAENLMIVDLLRNDLGKISKTGSVRTGRMFRVERYKTLLQMTSEIHGRLRKNISLRELFTGLFPSGSVTGAPKIRTMQIIKKLEKEPRHIYTGAIGFIGPRRQAVFNVAIRTLLLRNKKGEIGIGGGITWDSRARDEFNECRLKADFLRRKPFRLIETMLWTKKRFYLFDLHLQRLKRSARFFGIPFHKRKIRSALEKHTRGLYPETSCRLRLLLDREGNIFVESSPLPAERKSGINRIIISKQHTNSENIFLYHKTTNRGIYDKEYRKFRERGFFDVIYTNERGELTEGAITNIFVKKGKYLFTPPVSCGLLPGIYREHLKQTLRKKIREKILYPKDLKEAEIIYCGNSVRGLIEVRPVTGRV